MSDLPVKKNVARTFYIPGVYSQANTKIFQVNPTIAVSDFKYSIDGGTLTNLATLPDVYPAGGTQIRIQLAQAELNGNQINIRWLDAAGAEWCDGAMTIFTSSLQFGDIAAAVLDRLTSALTTVGSIGKLIVDNLNATISSRATPADVTVNLSVSATEAASVASGRLAITAGYTFRQTITSTTTDDLSAATKLWLAIKTSGNAADSASQIFVEKTAGLTVVAGAAYATAAHGSLTVSGSSGAWSIAIYIHDIATALLFGIGSDLRVAGLKYTKVGAAADDLSAWDGTAVIVDGVVRAVS